MITINREHEMNVLTSIFISELTQVITDLRNDSKVRVIIITGQGRAFCAGAALKEAIQHDFSAAREYLLSIQNVFAMIMDLEKPVIAAINGFALGGGAELAMSCDFRIMSDNARFGVPEVKLGAIAGAGGVQILPRIVGRGKALELALLGRHLTAEEAERAGLLYKRVPGDQLIKEARLLARELAELSPVGIAYAKQTINVAQDSDLKNSLRFGLSSMLACHGFPDRQEGISAFLEKRVACFNNVFGKKEE
jgi:enoyl-CoA hydratase/carnithine racemase